jgi:hypothetical protein
MEGVSDSHLERELIAEATKLQRALWQALVNVGKPTTPVRDLLDLYNHANDQPTPESRINVGFELRSSHIQTTS